MGGCPAWASSIEPGRPDPHLHPLPSKEGGAPRAGGGAQPGDRTPAWGFCSALGPPGSGVGGPPPPGMAAGTLEVPWRRDFPPGKLAPEGWGTATPLTRGARWAGLPLQRHLEASPSWPCPISFRGLMRRPQGLECAPEPSRRWRKGAGRPRPLSKVQGATRPGDGQGRARPLEPLGHEGPGRQTGCGPPRGRRSAQRQRW